MEISVPMEIGMVSRLMFLSSALLLQMPHAPAADGKGENFCQTLRPAGQLRSLGNPYTQAGMHRHRATGLKKVLVLRPTFSDDPVDPFPEARQGVLAQVKDLMRRNSWGALDLVFTIAPVTPLEGAKEDYKLNGNALAEAAGVAAFNAGFLEAEFEYVMIITRSELGRQGIAEISGKRSWCLEGVDAKLIAHELGHNFGLEHANSWRAENSSVTGEGRGIEYGNLFDIMGTNTELLENCAYGSHARYLLGWLPPESVAEMTGTGRVRLKPIDARELGAKHAVRVSARGRDYWLENRARSGGHAEAHHGLLVMWGPSARLGASTYLLDMQPGTRVWMDPLLPGQSFTDSFAGVTFVHAGKVDDEIEVVVHFADGKPNTPPTLQLTADKASAGLDEIVTLNAEAADVDGDSIFYWWMFSDGSFAVGPKVTHAFPSPSQAVAYCAAADGRGGVTRKHVTVKVGNGGRLVSGRVTSAIGPVAGAHIDAVYFEAYSDNNGEYLLPVPWAQLELKAFYDGMEFLPEGFTNPLQTSENRIGINFAAPAMEHWIQAWLAPDGSVMAEWLSGCGGCKLEMAAEPNGAEWSEVELDFSAPRMFRLPPTNPAGYLRLKRPF